MYRPLHWFLAILVGILTIAVGRSSADPASFEDGFDAAGAIEEAGSSDASQSPDWWVSSGAWLRREAGLARTLHGALPADDRWRQAYAASNPLDTEDGRRPQNVFRLVTRGRWADLEQQLWFRVVRTNMTDSPNREAWNGVQLFLRYQDSDNVYTAGLRVDGKAAIKRKRFGRYTTLGTAQVYPGAYDRWGHPNVLPEGRWIGLRTTSLTTETGSVLLRLDVEDPAIGPGWSTVLEVEDTSGDVILAPGSGGLRSDFMDLDLEGYAAISERPEDPAVTPTQASATATPSPTEPPHPTATPTPEPTSAPEPVATSAPKNPTPVLRLPSRPVPRLPW